MLVAQLLVLAIEECGVPANGVNTVAVNPWMVYEVGYVLTYRCHYGYKYDGDMVSTCQPDGTWSITSLPFCLGKLTSAC